MVKRVMINGREVLIPDEIITGKELKERAGIPANRNLIRQRPEGNFLVPNDQRIQVQEGDYFSDAPTFQYG